MLISGLNEIKEKIESISDVKDDFTQLAIKEIEMRIQIIKNKKISR